MLKYPLHHLHRSYQWLLVLLLALLCPTLATENHIFSDGFMDQSLNSYPPSNSMHHYYHSPPDGDNDDRPRRPESLYIQFMDLRDKASMDHTQLVRAIRFFNNYVSGFLQTKESWLQVLSMVLIYTDMFLDELPVYEGPLQEGHFTDNFNPWKLKSFATSSLLREQGSDQSPGLANGYRLAREEYGKNGKEAIGMKAQLWVPIDPLSTEANIIVFRGTCFTPTIKAVEKNLGTGMAMNMDLSGFGRTAFEEFWPVFNGWIDETRDTGRKLIITGHSLGGVISRRLHSRMYTEFKDWTTKNVESIVFNAPGLEPDMFDVFEHIPNAYHIVNAGDVITKIRLQPQSHLFLQRDVSPRLPLPSALSFDEVRKYHNLPGLVLVELRKGTAHIVPCRSVIPKKPRRSFGRITTKAMVQFQAASVRCPRLGAHMRVLKKRGTDDCSSLEAFRVELGPDGTAAKMVISPSFQRSLPSPEKLILIKNLPHLKKLASSLASSKEAIKAAAARLTHIHHV